ncbi:hypothetical protein [Hydrogenimonas sp.]
MIVLVPAATRSDVEKRVYESIFEAIFPQKESIYVWTDNEAKKELFKKIRALRLTDDQKKADILVLYKTKTKIDPDANGLWFAGTYLVYQKLKPHLFGAFYWQKGRPNLIFFEKQLQTLHIDLPDQFKKYIEANELY